MQVKPGRVRGVILTSVSTRVFPIPAWLDVSTRPLGQIQENTGRRLSRRWTRSPTPLSFGSWGHPTSFAFLAVMLPHVEVQQPTQTPPEVQPARSPSPSLFPSSWKNTSITCSDLARRTHASFWVTGFQFCRNYDWLTGSIELCG